MKRLRIHVVRGHPCRSSDGFQVFWDGGRGTINRIHPLTARRVLFWDDQAPMTDHLMAGHLMARHLDAVAIDGHCEGTHLLDRHLHPAAALIFETPLLIFGRFRFAVVTEDIAGNRNWSDAIINEQVVNSKPLSAGNLRPRNQDGVTGQMSFSFVPGRRLVG